MRPVKWKRLFVSVLLLSFCLTSAGVRAEEDTPDWRKRIDFGIEVGTDVKPNFYFQTVQPLYQSAGEDRTFFIQPRASARGDTEVYNLGIGYRWLNTDQTRLYGINTFYDYSAEHANYRLGAGLEALGKVLEGRLNTYWGLSDKRIIAESSTFASYEKVVDGFDVELGGPFIPHLPWLKIYGSGFWYDHKHSKDLEGWKLRARFEPMKITAFDFIVWDDNKGDPEVRVDSRVTIAFDTWGDIKDSFAWNDEADKDRDLKEEMLKPVERDHDVKVERWMETAGATIEVRRGN